MSKTDDVGHVYVLKHPETQEVRYVGVTSRSSRVRLSEHISVAKNQLRKTYCVDWIRSLLSQGLRPTLEVIDTVALDALNEKEVEYIAKYLQDGCRLTNHTSGGQANFTVSHETCEKIRAWHTGRPLSEAHRKAIALGQVGSQHSEATKMKMSESSKGRPKSLEHRKSLSKARKDKALARGENNPKAKLNEAKVLEIYGKIEEGYTDKQLADKYGVQKLAIYNVRTGRSWKHLHKERG